MKTHLEQFLEGWRKEIRDTAERLKNLGKPHSFPCPYCTRDVVVSYGVKGDATLRHKPSDCVAYAKPDKNTRGDLAQAFVFHCRPTMRFPALSGLEDGEVFKR